MKHELHGINLPLVAPLDTDGQLDKDAPRDEIRYHPDAGVPSAIVGGGTGEGMRVIDDQFKQFYDVAVGEVDGDVPVVVGVIVRQARETTVKAELARDAGMDFIMAMSPAGYVGSHMADNNSVRSYYRIIADVSELSIVIYDVMSLLNLDAEFAGDLVWDVPEVAGIKVSSTLGNLTYYLRATDDDSSVLGGMSIGQSPMHTLSINGGTVGINSVCPRISIRIWETTQRGDYDRVRDLHSAPVPLIRAVTENCELSFPAGEKTAADVLERDAGCLFHPFNGVEDDDEKRAVIRDAVS